MNTVGRLTTPNAVTTKPATLAGVSYSRLNPDAGVDDVLLVATTETNLDADIKILARMLGKVLGS